MPENEQFGFDSNMALGMPMMPFGSLPPMMGMGQIGSLNQMNPMNN